MEQNSITKEKRLTLTNGSLWKNIVRFSLPLILSNLLQVLFNMSDIAVVGQFSGSAALGSVGSTAILVALFTGFFLGLGSGVNSLVARHFGAGRGEQVEKSVHTSLLVSLLLGFVMLAVGQLVSRPLLELLGTKEELLPGAVRYLRIYFLGMPALAVYNFGNGVFSAVGNTKKPLLFLLTAGVLNVLLNLFFVIVCRWDVAGVACASVIAQYVSAILIVTALFRSRGVFALRWKRLGIHRESLRDVLSLGVPAGLQNAIFGVANLFIQSAVNTFSTVMVEGNSAAANADALIYDVMAAFYVACTSFTAQNYGAWNRKRVIRSYGVSLLYSFAAGAVLGGLLLLFGRQFLAIFTPDAAVVEAGMKRLTIMGASYGISALMDCSIAASRGLGKTLVPTVLVIAGSCVFRVIWVYTVFAHFQTIPSLYLLYCFSWTITGVAEALYFRRVYRKTFLQEVTS